MKKILKVVVFSSCAYLFTGCASTSSFTKLNAVTYPAKPKNCRIEVLSEEPKRPHDKLGFVTAVSGQTWFAAKGLDAMLPAMKEQACRVGADAIVLKQVEEGGIAWVTATQGKASGVAIKYLPNSEPANPYAE